MENDDLEMKKPNYSAFIELCFCSLSYLMDLLSRNNKLMLKNIYLDKILEGNRYVGRVQYDTSIKVPLAKER